VSGPHAPLAELLADLAGALARLGVRWYLFGAQAAILHGVARLTADVDVTVSLGARTVSDLVAALHESGFESRVEDATAFADEMRVVPVVHRATRIPVDLVLAGPGLEERFLSRAELRPVGGVGIPVAAAEDLVAMKLLAGRAKDLEDAAAIVRMRGEKLCPELIRETLRALEQALDRRDLLPALERLLRS
jgi:hypothetical protein